MQKHRVFFSLSQPVLIAGIPFNYALFILSTSGIGQLYIGTFVGLKATITIFFFAAVLYGVGLVRTKKDSRWFSVWLAAMKFNAANSFKKTVRYVA
jgi:type IV secretory pathway VirB3-like protein